MYSSQAKTGGSVLVAMLLFVTTSIFTIGCGEEGADMGFKAGRFGDYGDLGIVANDQWIEDDQEMRLAGNAAWDFAASRRSNGAGVSKSCDDPDAMGREWTFTGRGSIKIVELPLSGIAYGASGQIAARVLLEKDTTEPISVQLDVHGGSSARVEMTVGAATKEWIMLHADVPEQKSSSFNNSLSVSISLVSRVVSTTQVTVHSMSIFEPQHMPLRPAIFRDTTGATNKIGAEDWPLSTASRALLRDQQAVIHWSRAAKANILTQCFTGGSQATFTTYSTDMDRLGRWAVRKPYGGNKIEAVLKTRVLSSDVDIKASLWSLATIDYDTEGSAFTAGDILDDRTSGARARIVKVVDSGSTGTLHLAYITGTFGNNHLLRGRNSTTGAARGEALQNGAVQAGELVDYDVQAATFGTDGYLYFSLDTVDEDAEYEIRLDAEDTGGEDPPSVRTEIFDAHVSDSATTIAYKLPRSSAHEQDDPVRAGAYKAIKDTQNAAWNNQRAIVLHDFRSSVWVEKQKGWDSLDTVYVSRYNLASGVLYKAPGTRTVTARVVVSKPNLIDRRKLGFTGGSGSWVVQDILVGATSGAAALVEYIPSTTTGSLYLTGESGGSFQDGEALSTLGGWSGVADGIPGTFEGRQTIRLALSHTDGEALEFIERDLSLLGRGSAKTIELSVSINTNYFDNDDSVVGDHPLMWIIQAWTTEAGDPIILEQYQVFQAPLTTLDAELYEDEQ